MEINGMDPRWIMIFAGIPVIFWTIAYLAKRPDKD
jgi:hypothetical protein